MIQGRPALGDTVKLIGAVRVFESPTPVTVNVPVVDGAVGAVVVVSVAVLVPSAGGVTEFGTIDPVIPEPDGIDTDSATGELNELMDPTYIVKLVDEPFRTVAEVGDMVSEKSWIGDTPNVALAQ